MDKITNSIIDQIRINYKKYFFLFSLLLNILIFIGCGPQNEEAGFIKSNGTNDNSSRLLVPDTQANAPKDIAICNQLEDPLITIQLKVFYDQYNNYRPDLLRLYIPKIHSEFEKSNYHIVFRKWKADVKGSTYQDDTPLNFWAERKSDQALGSPLMDALQWKVFSTNLEQFVGKSYIMNDAFSKFNFVIDLKDPSGSFDVLKLSLYKDEEWVTDWNILLPAFYAHPTTYATEQNSVLAQLHPFYGQDNSTSGTEFANQLNSFCF